LKKLILKKLNLRISFILFLALLTFIFLYRLLYWLEYPTSYSQLIFSEDGRLLNATLAEDDQWRFYPDIPVPEKLKAAIITFEDKRFYKHLGIDRLALARAFWQNISQMRKVSGASTITMQLARLGRSNASRSIPEKLFEMLIALRLEVAYTKDEILQLWAARAPFGSNVVGFEAASFRYFGRNPNDLSWAEAALLAVLPNSPALIFPGRNHALLLSKRNRLLKKLMEAGYIDDLTYQLSLDEELPESFYHMPKKLPHLSQHVERLMKKKESNRYMVSIEPHLQEKLVGIAQEYQERYRRQNIRNISLIVAETKTGKVLGYVGNAGNEFTPGVQVDVNQSLRSTGSLLKPFLYGAALSEGIIAPNEILADLPVNYAGYSPKNYSDEYFGAVKASEALSRSLNVPMVRLLRKFGVDRFHRRLREVGLKSLTKNPGHYGLSLILGGADATLFELTGMYAAMGRVLIDFPRLSGKYNENNYQGLNFGIQASKATIYSEPPLTAGAVWYTLEAMRQLKRPVGEGQWELYSSSRPLAWKTGTSYGFRDAWAIGVDPAYTVGIWVGNADGESRDGLVGVMKAGPVLFDVFRILPEADGWFPKPWDDLDSIKICHLSGKPASEYCQHTKYEFLPKRADRSGVCSYCQPVLVNKKADQRFYRQCANGFVKDTTWFVLPAGMEWFYKKKTSSYKSLPALSQECSQLSDKINPIQFIYPHAGSRLVIPIDLTGEQNEVVFQAVHRYHNLPLFWYLDENFITTTENYHEIGIIPQKGWHTLLVEDPYGNRKSIRFQILEKNAKKRSTLN
jgi:penicillin-binding protein 1C